MAATNSTFTHQDQGWVARLFQTQDHSQQYQELKFTLHRKLLDRINLETLSAFALDRVRTEIRAAVAVSSKRKRRRSA